MIFADLLFLFVFLPINLIVYFLIGAKKPNLNITFQNAILVAFSLIFYAWGEPLMILLLVITTEVNRLFAIYIEQRKGTKSGKRLAVIAISLTLLSLAIFKYLPLFAIPFRLSLPIGISFYSFQIITYIVGVYKGDFPAQKSPMKFLMYVSLYPQLTAGPIVRYEQIYHEINERKSKFEDVSAGITRFVFGLAKKVIIANQVGAAAEIILKTNSGWSVGGAWIGIFFFSLQIYFDFSGYSDMAIGLGRVFGFSFPENFNYPYISKSITEFWRRWHMTLGGFFRDYVYIPLGGNRTSCIARFTKKSKHFLWVNLLIVWFLTGLWHGASWNFALWGLFFGLIIIAEKSFLLKLTEKIPAFVKIPVTFLLVTFGWALFYFTDFSQMISFIKSLLGINANGLYDIITMNLLYDKIFLIILAMVVCTPIYRAFEKLQQNRIRLNWLNPVISTILIVFCAILLIGDSYNPFLYYRF